MINEAVMNFDSFERAANRNLCINSSTYRFTDCWSALGHAIAACRDGGDGGKCQWSHLSPAHTD